MTPIESDPSAMNKSLTKVTVFSDVEDTTLEIPEKDPALALPVSTEEMILATREAFFAGTTKPLSFRKQQLRNLLRFMVECEDGIVEANFRDMQKPRQEVIHGELEIVKNDLRYTIQRLSSWNQPDRPDRRYFQMFDTLLVVNEPYGVVLIIGAWNYPFLLTLGPLVGAIAAGNCVIVKPSELSPHSAKFLQDNLPKYLDGGCYRVVSGGVEFTTSLLSHRFDHIVFTGSTAVGRVVYRAAAEHLTPVTMELGGKSPVYLDENVNIKQATRRIIWGKFVNAGQTCTSPDYLLCSKSTELEFLECAKEVILEFYGETFNDSCLSRIISRRHFDRLINLIQSGTCALGGQFDASALRIAPTVLTNVKPEDAVMQEEIFGPILPIITVETAEEAVEFVRKREKPLVAYVFTERNKVKEMFIERTSSGAVVVNETILHVLGGDCPFGGVGSSGFGAYHGKVGFDNFTHKKTVMKRGFGMVAEAMYMLRYPPYTELKTKLAAVTMQKRREWIGYKTLKNLIVFGAGMGLAFAIQGFVRHHEDQS